MKSKPKKKKSYRIRNWSEYNQALVQRGSLTVWFDDKAIGQWTNKEKSGKKGRSKTYTDTAILCGLTLKTVYRLPFRATEGLLSSIITLLKLTVSTPDHTTLERREKSLEIVLPRKSKGKEGLHLVIDSTGLKVYGEGEWKVRQHGWTKRRTWRKIHLGIDEKTGEIVAALVSTNDVSDSEALPDLLEQVEEKLEQVSADGAYDKRRCYDVLKKRKCRIAIPPRKDAKIWEHGNLKQASHPRDEAVRKIRKIGRRGWKESSGYHRRSLAETGMFRLKTLFGEKLSARRFENQATQALLRCTVMNQMTHLGMPESYAV